MKKIFAFTLLMLSLVMTTNAIAKNKGGFKGPEHKNLSVAEAHKMNDDAKINLKGKIEKALGNEKYQFNDGTGIIVIEIDDDEWDGLIVTPENIIEITGEIDKKMMGSPTIDVESITIIE